MKKRWKKRLITIGVVVVVAAGLVFGLRSFGRSAAEASAPATRTTAVERGTLTLSVSASGTVRSGKSHNVYSSLAYTVDTVSVTEGDYVEQGTPLAQLDTESLEFDIRQQKATLDSTETNTTLDIDSKLNSYEDAGARASVNVSNARRSYELLVTQVENGTYPELVSAQTAVDNAKDALQNAKLDLDTKTKAHDDNLFLFELGELSSQALDSSQNALTLSQSSYDSANRSHELALSNQQDLISRLQDDIETSRRNYESTQLTSAQEVDSARRVYEGAVTTSGNESAQIALEKLEKQLEDATVKAPISGTVTKVYAKEGNSGSGLLFIIEDLSSLEIVTKVKEYDISNVQPGMSTLIRSDATGDANVAGLIKSIAPTSEKSADGSSITASVSEYETIVTVVDADSGLKVGMNTRLDIILQTKDDVLSVPYDSVFENMDGGYSVYIVDEAAAENGSSRFVARAIPVEIGLETDFAVEISGDEITEGKLIIADPQSVTDGAEVKLGGPAGAADGLSGAPMMGGMGIRMG